MRPKILMAFILLLASTQAVLTAVRNDVAIYGKFPDERSKHIIVESDTGAGLWLRRDDKTVRVLRHSASTDRAHLPFVETSHRAPSER